MRLFCWLRGPYRCNGRDGTENRARRPATCRSLKPRPLPQIAKAEKLKPLEVDLRRLEDLSESIVKDFIFMKKREEEMRDTNGELWVSLAPSACRKNIYILWPHGSGLEVPYILLALLLRALGHVTNLPSFAASPVISPRRLGFAERRSRPRGLLSHLPCPRSPCRVHQRPGLLLQHLLHALPRGPGQLAGVLPPPLFQGQETH